MCAVHSTADVLLEVVFGQTEALSEKADVTYVKVWGHEREADIIHFSLDLHTVPTGPVTTEALCRFVFLTRIPFWEDSFCPFPQPPCKALVRRRTEASTYSCTSYPVNFDCGDF